MTSKLIYKGELRTICTHLASGNELLTDAPTDNQGRGEAFSPTDLTATSLAACMATIMGITANSRGWDISNTQASIVKIMSSEPRRIAAIEITFQMPRGNWTEQERKILEKAAKTCPVALSLHPDIRQTVSFLW